MGSMLAGIRLWLWRQEAYRIGIKLNPSKNYVQKRGQRGQFSGSKAVVDRHRYITIVTVDDVELSAKAHRRVSERRIRRWVAQYNTYSGAHERI
jgi:hypothetical protein